MGEMPDDSGYCVSFPHGTHYRTKACDGRADHTALILASKHAEIVAALTRERDELRKVCLSALDEVRKGTAADCERMLAHAAGVDCENEYGICDVCDAPRAAQVRSPEGERQ